MLKVSIIIPIYNAEKYLKYCLESIEKQTIKEIEVILINDGSTDRSKEICERFCKRDERFKLINKVNTGVSDSRNLGIKVAKSKYIMFVDADDWLEEKAVEISYNNIKKYNADICQFNYYFNSKNKQIKREDFEQYVIEEDKEIYEILQCNVISCTYLQKNNIKNFGRIRACWGKLFSKEFLEKNGLFLDKDMTIYEDTEFLTRVFMKMQKIIFVNEFLYHYRQNDSSVTKSFDTNKWNKNIKVLQKFDKYRKGVDNKGLMNNCIDILAFELLMNYLKYDIFNKEKKLKYKDRRKELKKAINTEMYIKLLKSLRLKDLTRNQKIIYFLVKSKCYFLIYILYYTKNKIKR